MRLCDDYIKMDIKETSFLFRLNYSLQQGTKRIFFLEKALRLFCKRN